jgi:hypothetical protein
MEEVVGSVPTRSTKSPPSHARCQSRFHSLLLLLYALSATASSQRQFVLGDAPCSRNICAKNQMFAGKVTCGVPNETSGQSWPSSTVATDPFTGQNRNSNVAAVSSTNVWAVSGQRLCTFRFKRFVEHWDGSTWSLEFLTFLPNHGRQRPFCSRDGCGVAGFCGPVKLLCRENLAISTVLSSVMSPSKVQL